MTQIIKNNQFSKKLLKSSEAIKRLFLGSGGQISVSAANLAMSISLMINVPPLEFGIYAFITIIIFFSFGLSNALLSSPLMIELSKTESKDSRIIACYFMVSFCVALLMSSISYACSYFMTNDIRTSLFFALAACFLFLTRLSRTYFFDLNRPVRVLLSDFIYSILLLAGIGISFKYGSITLFDASLCMALASAISFFSMGREVLKPIFTGISSKNFKPFFNGFKKHGRHSLIGVLTTEATSRAHAYIVTLWLGPAAFAPLAAASLFFRPVNLVMFSLTQYERPRLARLLQNKANDTAWKQLRFFYSVASFMWLANISLIAIILIFFKEYIVNDQYDFSVLLLAILFYAKISFISSIRAPLSTLLQANASFKILAHATVISGFIAIALVMLLTGLIGAIWSLLGVIIGEAIAAILVYKYAIKRISKT